MVDQCRFADEGVAINDQCDHERAQDDRAGKKLVYTFWSANIAEEFKSGPAQFPTADQIKQVCEAALRLGVRHLDMYGYRIGEYRVSRDQITKLVPSEPAPYRFDRTVSAEVYVGPAGVAARAWALFAFVK